MTSSVLRRTFVKRQWVYRSLSCLPPRERVKSLRMRCYLVASALQLMHGSVSGSPLAVDARSRLRQ